MSHQIVSQDEWLAARKVLLAKEKALTKERDALSQERRRLPWVKVDKTYVFEGPAGEETLANLFAGRNQLLVYHFMWLLLNDLRNEGDTAFDKRECSALTPIDAMDYAARVQQAVHELNGF